MNNSKIKHEDQLFLLNVAKLAAERSKAIRMKVGAVVTDSDGNMVAYGYNGTMKGSNNCCEDEINGILVTKESVIHAEQNLLAHAARRGISINRGEVFATHSPCLKCATLLVQAGISRFTYLEEYRTHATVEQEVGRYLVMRKFND